MMRCTVGCAVEREERGVGLVVGGGIARVAIGSDCCGMRACVVGPTRRHV